jgi:hypothetical protein
MIREEVLNLGGYGSNTECYAGSGCRTVIRDQALYLAKDQYTSILDLFGEQEMQILSITVKAKEQGALEAYQAGIKPVIEVYSIGKRAERVCVANCL